MTNETVSKKKQELEKKLSDLKESLTLKQGIYATQKSIRLLDSREINKSRKDETRKKILIGSYSLERMKIDAEFSKGILSKLNHYLVRDDDRILFNFPILEQKCSKCGERMKVKIDNKGKQYWGCTGYKTDKTGCNHTELYIKN